jgi:hypothetical protein
MIKLNKNSEWENSKYSIFNFSNDKHNFSRIDAKTSSLCLLPFDLNPNGQFSNVYLAKYHDYLKDHEDFRCLTDSVNFNSTDSQFEAIKLSLVDELGIENIDVNDVYYLGNIEHNIPFHKEYMCYAIDLTNYSEDPSGFTPKQDVDSESLHTVEKVKLSKVLTGEIDDTLVMSSVLRLLYCK